MVREGLLKAFYKIVIVSFEPDLATERGTRLADVNHLQPTASNHPLTEWYKNETGMNKGWGDRGDCGWRM